MKKLFLLGLILLIIVLGCSPPKQQQAETIQTTQTQETKFELTIPGITESDIRSALDAAKKVEDHFRNPPTPKLTPEQEMEVLKEVASIAATKKALSGSRDITIDTQQPGNVITITSVVMKEAGFIVIKKSSNLATVGSSKLLTKGVHQNVQISLNEYVDGIGLTVYLYKDDGDGILDTQKDKYITDDTGLAIYKNFDVRSRRNLRYAFYSNTIKYGPALILKEQLPGNKIKFEGVSIYTPDALKKSYFIVIFKDSNGLPGRIIGNSQPLKGSSSGNEVQLDEPVSNEMLYAMIFEDNGDGRFDSTSDSIVRGEDNIIIIVKFKVIQ